ncbi:MAG: alpha/beta fold hydrolase [Chitinophagaceae bacterium]|nr:alpha/beta fold hydrolase [Chitinophagaceae bacterium]
MGHLIIVSILTFCLQVYGKDESNFLSSEQYEKEERIEFISMTDTLVGYLAKPKNVEKFPVLVILHSANNGNHDYLLYNNLKETLTSINIGVFSFDRRGSGESEGDFNSASLEDLAKDAISAINALRERRDVHKDKIGLYGISQGGWIAPIAYKLEPTKISFMILVSSCGVTPSKQMEYSAVTTLRMQGYPNDVIENAVFLRKITDDYYRGKREKEDTQNEIDKFKHEPWLAQIYLPIHRDGSLPDDPRLTKWIHELDFDPIVYFEMVNIPLLLLYGESDRWVPIQESITVWKNSLKKSSNSKYEIYNVTNVGHMMILNEDNNPSQEIVSIEYSDKIKDWMLKNSIVE